MDFEERSNEKLAAHWKDAGNLVLGRWLVASPWALKFTRPGDRSTAAWNAWGVGTVIAMAALAALNAFQKWEEWVDAALAAWLIVSDYVLAFGTQPRRAGTKWWSGCWSAFLPSGRP